MSVRQRIVAASYLRTFVFGVEDSLASTVGLLSGLAAAELPREAIFLTGVTLIFVEAVSMAAGSFLSERSAENYIAGADRADKKPIYEALIMFSSYILSGLVPLAPYLLISGEVAMSWSILISLTALGLLGLVSAQLSHTSALKSVTRMVLIGGVAIAVGLGVGNLIT